MSGRSDPPGGQLTLGPRHGAEDGAGRRVYEAYAGPGAVAPPRGPRRPIDYPRGARRGWTRWIPSWRLVLSLFLLLVAACCAAVLLAYSRTELPSPNSDATFQTTIVTGADGKEIGRFSAQNRIWKPLDQIPRVVQDAVIAAEDRSFRTNQGVSFTGVVRAALNNARGGARQGGSTITQQYVKNFYSSTTDRTVGRKLNEFFVSIKIAQSLSKDEILERYLNVIYFGRGCYGVEAAAQCYFGKGVAKLSPSQAAYLAGIINGPELYDSGTASAKAAARARWLYVIDGMATLGSITPQQHDAARLPRILSRTHQAKQVAGDQTEYLLGMVREEAKARGISEQDLQRGGYRITTTFDLAKIRDAQRSVTQVLGRRRTWPKGTQVAIATIDAKNGQVVSVYAGDGERSQNAVTQDIAQSGSTFKPFGLVAALEGKREPGDCSRKAPDADSLSLRSRLDGHSPQRFDGLKQLVPNFGNEQFGMIDLVTATAHSVNTVYVGLNEKAGPKHTEAVARCAGYPSTTPGLGEGMNNVLGTSSPHPLDVARAYATFAAQGVYHDTYVIRSITKADGTVVAPEPEDAGRRVFDEGVMADATYAMQAVVKQGTASYVRNVGRPVAGKTGTTDDNLSAWFAGFTPRYATVVTMYRSNQKGDAVALRPWAGVTGQVVGGNLPARVWTDYMSAFLKGTPVQDFPEPTYGGGAGDPAPPASSVPGTQPAPSATATTRTSRPSPTTSDPSPSPSRSSSPRPTPSPSAPSPSTSEPGEPAPSPSRSNPRRGPRPRPTPSPRPTPTP